MQHVVKAIASFLLVLLAAGCGKKEVCLEVGSTLRVTRDMFVATENIIPPEEGERPGLVAAFCHLGKGSQVHVMSDSDVTGDSLFTRTSVSVVASTGMARDKCPEKTTFKTYPNELKRHTKE